MERSSGTIRVVERGRGLASEKLAADRSWQRLDGVDLLRGLSILLVVVLHTNIRIPLSKTAMAGVLPGWLLTMIGWNGDNGVTIFFAVSGFLITSTALRRWGSLGAIEPRRFYGLRFARIAPLLLVLVAILSTLHLLHTSGYVIRQTSLARAVIAVLGFHFNWLEGRVGYLPGNWDILWSLSVEEAFYLFFPLAGILLRRSRPALLALLLLFVAMGPFARTMWTAGRPVWQEKSYLGGMDAIALGCLTALLLPHFRTWYARKRGSLVTIEVSATLMLALILGSHWATGRLGLYRSGLDGTVLALGSCGLILASAIRQRRARWFAQPLAWLGRNSYEIYLTHMFVVTEAAVLWKQAGKPLGWVTAGVYVAVVLIAALLGGAVGRWFAEPANRYLRRRWNDSRRELGAVSFG